MAAIRNEVRLAVLKRERLHIDLGRTDDQNTPQR